MNTSQLAHQNALNFKEKHHAKIVNVLSEVQRDLTYKEIAKYLGWSDPNKVSRRLKELREQGKITIKEVRKCTIAKSKCSSYILCN